MLVPLSWLYGFGVWFRNMLFDTKILRSEQFETPIITIGNLTVGGTGKTPHTEYLIQLMCKFNIAVLSRGYKRQTKGFVLASKTSSSLEIGDEPKQIKQKFPHVHVAVDGNRRRGIRKLQESIKNLDLILLDDAYQHRYVKPSLSILLMDYNRPIYQDSMLPNGDLREPFSEARRANIVIVTKTPDDVKPIDKRIVSKHLNLFPFQTLFFSRLKHGTIQPVFSSRNTTTATDFYGGNYAVVLLTGIASTKPLLVHLRKHSEKIEEMAFPDHHNFKASDIVQAHSTMEKLTGYRKKIIITTEKDAVRLRDMSDFPEEAKEHLYFVPLEIEFINDDDNFDESVINLLKRAQPITIK